MPCVRFRFLLAEMGECHSCTQHPVLLKMAILYHRNPSLSTDSSHRRPAGNHSSACLFFRIAAAITSFTLSCLMAAGYFLTISASAALAARSSSLSSTNRADRSSQARILCHYFNLMALPTSGVFFIGGVWNVKRPFLDHLHSTPPLKPAGTSLTGHTGIRKPCVRLVSNNIPCRW